MSYLQEHCVKAGKHRLNTANHIADESGQKGLDVQETEAHSLDYIVNSSSCKHCSAIALALVGVLVVLLPGCSKLTTRTCMYSHKLCN